MQKDDFYSNVKFLLQGEDYILELIDEGWWNLPPITSYIDATNECSQNCIWCMFKYLPKASMTQEQILDAIEQVGELGCKSVVFSGGGEPLVNEKAFPKAFYAVTDMGMKCALKTNGEFLEKYAEDVASNCTYVKVSIDAGKSETYWRLHKSQMWSKVWNGVKALAKIYDGELGVDFLVHPRNYDEVFDFLVLAEDSGVSHAGVRPVLLEGLRLSDEVFEKVNSQVKQFRRNSDFPVYSRMYRVNEERTFEKCLATPFNVVIGADLKVYSCCRKRGLGSHCFGNLRSESLEEIWHGEKRRKVVESIKPAECLPFWCWTATTILEKMKGAKHIDFL